MLSTGDHSPQQPTTLQENAEPRPTEQAVHEALERVTTILDK